MYDTRAFNNTSPSDSGEYSLSLRLTDNIHNELANDLIPTVEPQYSTYAASTDPEDFFIFTASGTDDFAYSGFKRGMETMGNENVFVFADNEQEGDLSFREWEGYSHN